MTPELGTGRADDEQGIVLVATAITVTVLIIAVSFAIDLGGRAQQKRQDHLVADLAALDAVPYVPVDAASVTLAATQSAARNGGGNVTAVRGHWNATTRVFTPETVTACPCDSVKTTASSTYQDFFSPASAALDAWAVAQPVNEASFTDGSTLVSVNNGLGLFGAGIALTAVGYHGLVTGNVSLVDLGTSLGFSGLTADQILASQVKVSQLVAASANLLAASNPTSSAALTTLASSLSVTEQNDNRVTIGSILGLQQGNGTALTTTVNLLKTVSGGIQLANQKAGLSGNLAVSAPGLSSATFAVSAIVPASPSSFGPPKPATGYAFAFNDQVTANVTLNLLPVLGAPTATVNLNLTVGHARGDLTAANCTNNAPIDIHIGTTFNDVGINVTGGTGVGLGIGGIVNVPSNPVTDTTLTYASNFEPSGTPKTASSSLGTPTVSLTGVAVPLLGILSGSLFSSVVTGLDSALIGLGVTVGNADYLGVKLQCGVGNLVA